MSSARIIVLRTGDAIPSVAEKCGQFFDYITRTVGDTWSYGWELVDVRLPDVDLPDPRSATGFIITGSPSSVTERAPWMLRTEEYVRRIAAAEVPLLGICFGHQLIGQALGGEVAKNPRGREIGTVRLEVSEGDPILEGQPRVFDVQATHSDSVVRLPPGARVLASTELEPNTIFSVGPYVRGVQHHPEMDDVVIRGYVEARYAIIESEGLDAGAILRNVRPTPENGRTLRNFVRNFCVARV
ncbi:glutamine amidotransferase [Pendulispora albinea]|uniref:Glutamine amidotransferase n=1 Tax=Pendulispora albinea TaxID=2741071 RepID=A0ABZ2M563_9BACT